MSSEVSKRRPLDIRLLTGRTPVFASTLDQRFSFGLHLPRAHTPNSPELPLLVVVHGLSRRIDGYLETLKRFSDQYNCVVMCPLFPAGIIDPEDMDNYKNILYKDIRFDLILLSMVDQASKVWRIRTDKFFLHGFSGGGQLAHRFFYLHPDRLLAISIGSPGNITTPNTDYPWPKGLADVGHKFGIPGIPDFQAMARVAVQLVVGEDDLEVIEPDPASPEAGETRVDKIQRLKAAFCKVGVQSELVIVPGVGHAGQQLVPAVETWLIPLVEKMGKV
jgi:pimeloyl-ACP methyl ester carboxylesterase